MSVQQPANMKINELDVIVHSRAEWRALWQSMPMLFTEEIAESFAAHVREFGLLDPQMGFAAPDDIVIGSKNYRETVRAHGLISRLRGLLLMLQEVQTRSISTPRVFASEALSPLARRLQSTLEHFEGSEYLPTEEDRARHPDVTHQNVQALDLEDSSFDIYISCDVLEHVPDLTAAILEAARILRPGGVLMGTVPFAANRDETLIKARLVNGEIEHLMDPEYHGNPTRPEEGSLVFQVPGWDLFDQFRTAGFKRCGLRLISSRKHGVFGAGVAFSSYFFAEK